MRPCADKHKEVVPKACHICWLYETDVRYRELWGGDPFTMSLEKLEPRNKTTLCKYLGDVLRGPQGDVRTIACKTCKGSVQLKLYACYHPSHKETTLRDCNRCSDYTPLVSQKKLKWTYGVTTVTDRRKELFPRTLKSLKEAGFDQPHVFVDGDDRGDTWRERFPGLTFTLRSPRVRTAGHWVLSMYELYIRTPDADRYALFQDDLVAIKGLREYLEKASYPEDGYLNLFTFASNHGITPKQDGKYVTGWFKGRELSSGPPGFQTGRGAVALVFSREALGVLLTSQHLFNRPTDPDRGWRAVDGGIVSSMNKAGWFEYVHHPSLVQHVGLVSSMGNRTHPQTKTFPGENFDAKNLQEGATQCADWGI